MGYANKYINSHETSDLIVFEIVKLSRVYVVSYSSRELAEKRVSWFPDFILDKEDRMITYVADKVV